MQVAIKDRALAAEGKWKLAQEFEQGGELDAAYATYTEAHDLVIDCPRLHWRSHQHLARINWKRRNIKELIEDRLLLSVAPLGIFVLIAYLLKKQVLGEELCKGKPPQ